MWKTGTLRNLFYILCRNKSLHLHVCCKTKMKNNPSNSSSSAKRFSSWRSPTLNITGHLLVYSMGKLSSFSPGSDLASAGEFPSTLIDLGGRASRPFCYIKPQTDAQEVLSPTYSCVQLSVSSDLTRSNAADLHAHLFLGCLLAFPLEIHLAWHLA